MTPSNGISGLRYTPSTTEFKPGRSAEEPYRFDPVDSACLVQHVTMVRDELPESHQTVVHVALGLLAPGPLGPMMAKSVLNLSAPRSALMDLQRTPGPTQRGFELSGRPTAPSTSDAPLVFRDASIVQPMPTGRYVLTAGKGQTAATMKFFSSETGRWSSLSPAQGTWFAERVATALISREDVPQATAKRVLHDVGQALANESNVEVTPDTVKALVGERTYLLDRQSGETRKMDNGRAEPLAPEERPRFAEDLLNSNISDGDKGKAVDAAFQHRTVTCARQTVHVFPDRTSAELAGLLEPTAQGTLKAACEPVVLMNNGSPVLVLHDLNIRHPDVSRNGIGGRLVANSPWADAYVHKLDPHHLESQIADILSAS